MLLKRKYHKNLEIFHDKRLKSLCKQVLYDHF